MTRRILILIIAAICTFSSASASEGATVDSDNKIREGVYLGVAGPMAGLVNLVLGEKGEHIGGRLMLGGGPWGYGFGATVSAYLWEDESSYLSVNPAFSFYDASNMNEFPFGSKHEYFSLSMEYNWRGLFLELGPAYPVSANMVRVKENGLELYLYVYANIGYIYFF